MSKDENAYNDDEFITLALKRGNEFVSEKMDRLCNFIHSEDVNIAEGVIISILLLEGIIKKVRAESEEKPCLCENCNLERLKNVITAMQERYARTYFEESINKFLKAETTEDQKQSLNSILENIILPKDVKEPNKNDTDPTKH